MKLCPKIHYNRVNVNALAQEEAKETAKIIKKRGALLLNTSFEALNVISWQKSIILWLTGKVEVLEFHEFFVHSPSAAFPVPSVIRLKTYVAGLNHRRVRFSKYNVYLRDKGVCQYCGKKCSSHEITIDHVIPVSKQGPENWNNVVAACRHCNQKKGNRTPAAAGMPLLREPESPRWVTTIELELSHTPIPKAWRSYLGSKAG